MLTIITLYDQHQAMIISRTFLVQNILRKWINNWILFGKGPGGWDGWDSWDGWDGWDSWD